MNEPIFSVLTGKSCTNSGDCGLDEVCCNDVCYLTTCGCTNCWGDGINKGALGIPISGIDEGGGWNTEVWCKTDNNGNPINTYTMEVIKFYGTAAPGSGTVIGYLDCPGFGGDFYQPQDPNCSDPDEYIRPGQTVSWTCTTQCCPGGWVYS